MPARTGAEYIAGLRERATDISLHGEQVKDVTTHPALRNGVHTLGSGQPPQVQHMLAELIQSKTRRRAYPSPLWHTKRRGKGCGGSHLNFGMTLVVSSRMELITRS
jgi:hypothetical protein